MMREREREGGRDDERERGVMIDEMRDPPNFVC